MGAEKIDHVHHLLEPGRGSATKGALPPRDDWTLGDQVAGSTEILGTSVRESIARSKAQIASSTVTCSVW